LRRDRLTEDSEFKRVRHEGRSWAHPLLVMYARRGDNQATRVGISVSRRLGSAVVRNRVKRRIREAMRRRLQAVRPGWDLVLIARTAAAAARYQQLAMTLDHLLRRAGLLVSPIDGDEQTEG
jgi:ribonuclease P protein component